MPRTDEASYYQHVYESGLPEIDLEGDSLLQRIDRDLKRLAAPLVLRALDKADKMLYRKKFRQEGRGEVLRNIAGSLIQWYGLDRREARAVTRGLALRADKQAAEPEEFPICLYELGRNPTAVSQQLHRFLSGWGEKPNRALERAQAIDPDFQPGQPVPNYRTAIEKRAERVMRKVLLEREGYHHRPPEAAEPTDEGQRSSRR